MSYKYWGVNPFAKPFYKIVTTASKIFVKGLFCLDFLNSSYEVIIILDWREWIFRTADLGTGVLAQCVWRGRTSSELSNGRWVWEWSSWEGKAEVPRWPCRGCWLAVVFLPGALAFTSPPWWQVLGWSNRCHLCGLLLPECLPCWVFFQSHHPTWLFLQFVCYPVGWGKPW